MESAAMISSCKPNCLSHVGAVARRITALVVLAPVGLTAQAADCPTLTLPPFDAAAGSAPGWVHVPLSKLKRDTRYAATTDEGKSVLKAEADGAASAYVHMARPDPARLPILEWRWRAKALIEAANNRDPKLEDAPVRLIVGFDGDMATLTSEEQRRLARAKKISGKNPPYATLMYIWENRAPVGTVIPSAHSTRVKMIVAESGVQGVGAWRSYRRNLLQDYQRAFGGTPRGILGVAVMTDTDNTGAKAEGFYGEIRLTCAAPGDK
jgi:hypothetical protein